MESHLSPEVRYGRITLGHREKRDSLNYTPISVSHYFKGFQDQQPVTFLVWMAEYAQDTASLEQ